MKGFKMTVINQKTSREDLYRYLLTKAAKEMLEFIDANDNANANKAADVVAMHAKVLNTLTGQDLRELLEYAYQSGRRLLVAERRGEAENA